MHRYENRHQLLAVGLAVLAGFVDALGFLNLRGMFVSFMSGNSTRLAVGAETPAHGSLFAGALIAVFVAGVMAGTAVGTAARRWRKQAVLMIVLLVLTVACFAANLGEESVVPALLMAAAMGAANAVFQREGEVSIGVTYMTGTLVKLGQHLTIALSGGPRFAWVSYSSALAGADPRRGGWCDDVSNIRASGTVDRCRVDRIATSVGDCARSVARKT